MIRDERKIYFSRFLLNMFSLITNGHKSFYFLIFFIYILKIMSIINQSCPHCKKPLERFAVLINKCVKHDFKFCTGCAAKFKGKDCPQCAI